MPLTQNDLQQVGKLLQKQLDPIKQDLGTVKQDLKNVKQDLGNVKQDLEELKKGQRSIKRQLTRVKKDIKWITRNDDTRIVENQRELDKVKQFVGYPTAS